MSDLIKRIGKPLGEYFLGTESYKTFDEIFFGKVIPNTMTLLGTLTMALNTYFTSKPLTSKENLTCGLVGITTIALSEMTRFYVKNYFKKNKIKGRQQI